MEYFAKEESLKFTESMKTFLETKLQKLSKYIKDLDGRVVLKKEGSLKKLEISLPGNIRSSAVHENYYEAVLIVIHQLEKQLDRYKQVHKTNKRKRNNSLDKLPFNISDYLDNEVPEIDDYKIIEKYISKEIISKEEAIEKMELLGHNFYAFINIENENFSVIYKRLDGQYGCLILN